MIAKRLSYDEQQKEKERGERARRIALKKLEMQERSEVEIA